MKKCLQGTACTAAGAGAGWFLLSAVKRACARRASDVYPPKTAAGGQEPWLASLEGQEGDSTN